jgi:hypothetical protein
MRAVGAFVLFLVLYSLIGSVAGAFFIYAVGSAIGIPPPKEGSTPDMILNLFFAVLAGFLGVTWGSAALKAIMKDYPARGIGVAFIVWLIANYAVHFIFFPQWTDFTVYQGLVASAVACVTTWFVFRLPPLSRE